MTNRKILIVDDSMTARAMFGACMHDVIDCEILQAPSWDIALDKAVNEDPCLIFLDYNMPDKVGTEVARLIKEAGVNCPMVLLTANTQEAVVEEATQLGFISVIEKPISSESLIELMDKLI